MVLPLLLLLSGTVALLACGGHVVAAASHDGAPKRLAGSARISVIYYSETNHTKTLAEAIAEGAQSVGGAEVEVVALGDANVTAHILEADAVVIGTPVHFGNVASAFLQWVEHEWAPHWQPNDFAGKLGGVFATSGGIAQGVEHVLSSLQRTLMTYNFRLVLPDATISKYSSYGVIAATATPPFNMSTPGQIAQCFKDEAVVYGKQIATVAIADAAASLKCKS
eukprot:INCI967.1.p1 GENE.INCI967.1~~INCI967.1.p1  ORF type:complete len:223 (+),score=44.11 INCI967.1:170-838(+)